MLWEAKRLPGIIKHALLMTSVSVRTFHYEQLLSLMMERQTKNLDTDGTFESRQQKLDLALKNR
jgi:hypothetical protein